MRYKKRTISVASGIPEDHEIRIQQEGLEWEWSVVLHEVIFLSANGAALSEKSARTAAERAYRKLLAAVDAYRTPTK